MAKKSKSFELTEEEPSTLRMWVTGHKTEQRLSHRGCMGKNLGCQLAFHFVFFQTTTRALREPNLVAGLVALYLRKAEVAIQHI